MVIYPLGELRAKSRGPSLASLSIPVCVKPELVPGTHRHRAGSPGSGRGQGQGREQEARWVYTQAQAPVCQITMHKARRPLPSPFLISTRL